MRIVSPPAATTYAFMPLPHQPVNQLHSTARRGLRLVALALLLLAAPRMAQAAPNVAPSFVLGNTVVAWGRNDYGQTNVPAGLSGVTAIAAGSSHTVAISGRALTSVIVAENAGAQTLNNVARSISPGPADEAAQTVVFTVTNNNNALFSVQPALTANGTLTFTPAPNTTGSATVTVVARDNGGTASGGVDTSAPQTFTISVEHAPTVVLPITDFAVNEDAANVVRNLTLTFSDVETLAASLTYAVVGNTNALLVTATITQGTNLTLTFATNGNGTSWIAVRATDAGGLSVTNAFVVTVHPVNDAPSFALGNTVVAWGWNPYGQTNVPAGLSGVTAIAAG